MLEQSEVIKVMQDAIYTMLIVSAPVLLVGMLVGTIISIFQATTQINEQSLSFVPKIVAIMVTIVIFGGWMLSQLSDFTLRLFEYIRTMID